MRDPYVSETIFSCPCSLPFLFLSRSSLPLPLQCALHPPSPPRADLLESSSSTSSNSWFRRPSSGDLAAELRATARTATTRTTTGRQDVRGDSAREVELPRGARHERAGALSRAGRRHGRGGAVEHGLDSHGLGDAEERRPNQGRGPVNIAPAGESCWRSGNRARGWEIERWSRGRFAPPPVSSVELEEHRRPR
jgi:hypothetical protein